MSIRRLHPRQLTGAPPPRWWLIVIVRIVVLIIVTGLALFMLNIGIGWAVVGAVLALAATEARKLVHVSGLA
jgi:hypothetical protein